MGALVLVGLLYYRPLHDYFTARTERAVQLTAVRNWIGNFKPTSFRLTSWNSYELYDMRATRDQP